MNRCIHCRKAPRDRGVYCVECWAQALTRMRVASRSGRGAAYCVNRGRGVRARKVARVIEWYGRPTETYVDGDDVECVPPLRACSRCDANTRDTSPLPLCASCRGSHQWRLK